LKKRKDDVLQIKEERRRSHVDIKEEKDLDERSDGGEGKPEKCSSRRNSSSFQGPTMCQHQNEKREGGYCRNQR